MSGIEQFLITQGAMWLGFAMVIALAFLFFNAITD